MKPTNLKILSIIAIFIGILIIIIPLISYYTTPIWLRKTDQEICFVACLLFGIVLICGGIIDYFRAEREILEDISEGKKTKERYCPNCGLSILLMLIFVHIVVKSLMGRPKKSIIKYYKFFSYSNQLQPIPS